MRSQKKPTFPDGKFYYSVDTSNELGGPYADEAAALKDAERDAGTDTCDILILKQVSKYEIKSRPVLTKVE